MASKPPQRGRPPGTASAETRKRIVDVARRLFAEYGYDATTNRLIADGAAITTGAIYHYFDSKLDIFWAVLAEVEARIEERFLAAEASATTMVGKIEGVMEAFHELNNEDASVAQFVGSARIDRKRHPEVFAELKDDLDGDGYYRRLIDSGIANGELRQQDREPLRYFLRAIAVGLTDGVSSNQVEHRLALDGLKFVLSGGVVAER